MEMEMEIIRRRFIHPKKDYPKKIKMEIGNSPPTPP
jgi:hypothetical protein